MVGQVASRISTVSAIMKTPNANEVNSSLFVFNREYAQCEDLPMMKRALTGLSNF